MKADLLQTVKKDLARIQERGTRQKTKRAAEADHQAQSCFIANISHDLRTPLMGLLGMAMILQQQAQTDSAKAAVADILKSGEILLKLLNEVIEFVRCLPTYFPVHIMKFDLKKLVNDLIFLFKPSIQEKRLYFSSQWDEQLPQEVMGDPFRLQRILLNLLSNAIKFTHRGAIHLRIRLMQIKQHRLVIECQVEDTGIGIPTEQLECIFSCFTRLHPSHQGQYSGPGLGLTLTKQFVEDLAGEIAVESVEGRGSIFTCLIPLRSVLPLVESTPAKSISTVNQRKRPAQSKGARQALSILVVEDNIIAQQAVRHLLASRGASVDTADNGAQALQKIQVKDYALIVMDLGLPDQNGCALAHTIRDWQQQQQRKISVIVALSAHMDAENRQRCLEAGMSDAFAKPLTTQTAPALWVLVEGGQKKQRSL